MSAVMNGKHTSHEDGRQSVIEFGLLLGTLALGVVLTLVAIGTQVRTVMTEPPNQHIGEP